MVAAAVAVLDVDVLIFGSGFGGSLTGLLARQMGLRAAIVDRTHHPRFAIGESTTPLANLVLEGLAQRYGLPRLLPLVNYASWKAAYPQVVCGLKRGFSYFGHRFDEPFRPRSDHQNELLVAASQGEADADTHWLRADVDQFLAQEAVAAGIPLWEDTVLVELHHDTTGWTAVVRHRDEARQVHARFVVDATGEGGCLAQRLGLTNAVDSLHTHSRAVFAHFLNVVPWREIYATRGGRLGDHPFPCDAAALHHVFDGGWMYQLRFDNGITSAGFCLDPRQFPEPSAQSPDEEFAELLRRLPAVREQFAGATPVSHGGRIVRSGRLQRRFAPAAGTDWALLPHAAGFIDPLHSTGIAQTLFGIERLACAWEQHWNRSTLADAMAEYNRRLQTELEFIDTLVAGCYRGFGEFPRLAALTMFYFAAATWSERCRRAALHEAHPFDAAASRPSRGAWPAYLCADDEALRTALHRCARAVSQAAVSTTELMESIASAIAPYNHAGLCDPSRHNMYPHQP